MSKYQFLSLHEKTKAIIPIIFHRMEEEGLYDSFFYNSQCKDAEEFERWLLQRAYSAFAIVRDDAIVGFAVLDDFNGASAFLHHCQFRCGWKFTKQTAKASLAYIARFLPDVQTLVGLTPSNNKLAVRYALRMGFELVGTVNNSIRLTSGQVVDGIVTQYSLR